MGNFRIPDFVERQNAATKARQAALERFRANAADPTVAERQTARTASAADRTAAKKVRDVEKAEQKAVDAEIAKQAAHDAAVQAERILIENATREFAVASRTKGDQGRALRGP